MSIPIVPPSGVVQLTPDQVSEFLGRHWLFWLDYTLGTVSATGESVYDDTWGGYVFMFNASNGVDLVFSTQQISYENLYAAMADVGVSSAAAVGTAAADVGAAAVKTVSQVPTMVTLAAIAAGLYFLYQMMRDK